MDNYFEELCITDFCGVKYMHYKYIEQQEDEIPSHSQIGQVANILAALHDLNYVHSDIRMDNIILCLDGLQFPQ